MLVVCVHVYVESKGEHQISSSISPHLISGAEPEGGKFGKAGRSVSSTDPPASVLPSLGPQVCTATRDFCAGALDLSSGAYA